MADKPDLMDRLHAELVAARRLFDARERDRKRFKNDPARCQDCGYVEACQCDGRSV